MKNEDIIRLEEIAINAHPAPHTYIYDGWIIRYAYGYTGRANSVQPLYRGIIPADEKLVFCEKFYAERGQPCIFKMTEAALPDGLDGILEAHGYEKINPTLLMTMEIGELPAPKHDVRITYSIDEAWLSEFYRLSGITDESDVRAAGMITRAIQDKTICAAVYDGEKMIACGLGVAEDDHIGLYDIRTDEEYRRRGYGTDICLTILAEGKKLGADTAYLQVVEKNAAARAMYGKMGFDTGYKYWYRRKNQ